MKHEKVLILDFGGQYNQLIARRVRDLGVYCEVRPYTTPLDEIQGEDYRGIIFTGGPNSVNDAGSPAYETGIYQIGLPILGICYGAQLMAASLGGAVETAPVGEYGTAVVHKTGESRLFAGIEDGTTVAWMSHHDRIAVPPAGFTVTARTEHCPVAAMENAAANLYAVQFHPEVEHSADGDRVLSAFIFDICKCTGDWKMDSFIEATVADIRRTVGDGKVLLALSGGVDSSVCAALVHRAIGKNLTCIFVDHGLMRQDEPAEVYKIFKEDFDINLIAVDASARFLDRLAGVADPERKRKIIGEEFIRVFEDEAGKLGQVDYLVQGTIYPDIIESGVGDSAVIKSHHNVGGLPYDIAFKAIIEPLRLLFKDEVRKVGLALGLPERLVWRQPFPGPGLGVRIIGEITREKIKTLQHADAVYRNEIEKAGLAREISQYFAVLTNVSTVGVMGDGRTYDHVIALRAVKTSDFMTADWYPIPIEVLSKISSQIVNQVPGINRIVYDITNKPPATIEWE